MSDFLPDETRARISLPPEHYGALLGFIIKHDIVPDLKQCLIEQAGVLIINLCMFGPDHPATFSILRLRASELQELHEKLPDDSSLGRVVVEAMQTINAYNVTKEVENGMQSGPAD